MDESKNANANINNKSESNGNNLTPSRRKTTDSKLKASIIDFMRDRPFLWNTKDPNYKDHKRREHEFQEFSKRIGCSVQEIKRIWHVLRTNFFRAHKLLLDRPQGNGENTERLWRYYLAMDYVLEGVDHVSEGDLSRSDARQTRSCKASKDFRISVRPQQQHHHLQRNLSNASASGDSASRIASHDSSQNLGNDPSPPANGQNKSMKLSPDELSLDTDDDHLYARSLTSTLKRFDPTTKEIIKLKFQEIIVSYMQRQSGQTNQQDCVLAVCVETTHAHS